MARVPRTTRDARTRYQKLGNPRLMAQVCKHFCEGESPQQIRIRVQNELGITLQREDPYILLSHAASQGWLKYVPQLDSRLADDLKSHHGWLDNIEVVPTRAKRDVTFRAAQMLLNMIRAAARKSGGREPVHVGLAGGNTVRGLAEDLGRLLGERMEGLPRRIVFHSLVTGMQVNDPDSDPSTFYSLLRKEAPQIEIGFVSLYGPAMAAGDVLKKVWATGAAAKAKKASKQINIIVGSGTSWLPHLPEFPGSTPARKGTAPPHQIHSQLRTAFEGHDPESLALLKSQRCVGDMFWQPLAESGPIESDTAVQAMTLWKLSELSALIEQERLKVLLLLGPCGACGAPKGQLLKTIVEQPDHMITHLVVDSWTALQALGDSSPRRPDRNG